MIRALRDAIRRWDARFGTDDAPLWAEVIAVVCAPGVMLRAMCHVWSALFADALRAAAVDPQLAPRSVTPQSPVVGCRAHASVDAGARLLSAITGVVAATFWPPTAAGGVVGAWLAVNWLVLLSDPVQFAGVRARAWYRARSDRQRTTGTTQ